MVSGVGVLERFEDRTLQRRAFPARMHEMAKRVADAAKLGDLLLDLPQPNVRDGPCFHAVPPFHMANV